MKFMIVFLAVASVALAADITVLKSDQNINNDGTYNYAYELSNGAAASLTGTAESQQGTYKFISPEGENFEVNFVADENGFQPTGAHLPVAPATPTLILKALEYIRTHPSAERK